MTSLTETNSTDTEYTQLIRKKRSNKTHSELVSIPNLFRYATFIDIFYIGLGTITSCVFGLTQILSTVVLGNTINSFVISFTEKCSNNLTRSDHTSLDYDLNSHLKIQIIYFIVIGCVTLICSYVRFTFLTISAERQIRTIRKVLFKSILSKEISYLDTCKTAECNVQLTDDVNKIRDGIDDKIGSLAEVISTLISAVIIGCIKGWRLTLVSLSAAPIIIITFIIGFKIITDLTKNEIKAYWKSGAIAEEAISSIRTVLSYNGQEREINRYERYLDDAKTSSIKRNTIDGIIDTIIASLICFTYSLGFWYGTRLIWNEGYTVGDVYIVFTSIYMGMFRLQKLSPCFQALNQARAAAYTLWCIIDSNATVSSQNLKTDELKGDIEFSNVHFCYPSRPNISILNGVSFNVNFGQCIALVGSSGSGKSTCAQLLQRFYDPTVGSISIDGRHIKEYDVRWLRQHIGVVSQEPVLFYASVRQNILFGRGSATDEEIYEAARMANAHDFIMTLPDKYETIVGERGAKLSGGQKQRIAIARALIRDPKVLLLDEATSALDCESETTVQEALDRASQGRTTLIIAHRLSTIRYANKIIVIDNGKIIEEGDHISLIQAKGAYFQFVQQQTLRQTKQKKEEMDEDLKSESTDLVTSSKEYPNSLNFDEIGLSAVSSQASSMAHDPLSTNSASQGSDRITEKGKEDKKNTVVTIFRMNKPEWIFIIIGCLAAVLFGATTPVFSIGETRVVTVFLICDEESQRRNVLIYIFLFLGLGIACYIFHPIQSYMFAKSGALLTKRLRSEAFRAILRQETAFFDQEEHSTGALCTRLATEASIVQGASGVHLGIFCQNIASVGVGVLIGFIFSWQMTLLGIAFLPLVLCGTVLQARIGAIFYSKEQTILENSGKVAIECIQNIRTVIQLTKEDHFYQEYSQLLDTLYQTSLKRAHISGIIFSLSNSVYYFNVAAFVSLGTFLISKSMITFDELYMVYNTVTACAQYCSRELALSPNYGRGVKAAKKIFELLNRQPMIDNESAHGDEIVNFNGQLEFDGIYFAYPNRPQSLILRNFRATIKHGQKVAFVGESGCGKSTSIQLIERFYDPNHGRLLVDSKDIRSLNLQWYRSQIGIVSQEPVLFDMSIRENIAYGDNSRDNIPLDEIVQVAKIANVHDFIQTLPYGYETNCGLRGTQLSGGQKQRIAIARALIRNPKLLLLDEATSALDSENENLVQEALDRAQQHRTSITIAHRLSTIQNADMIFVMHNGKIVEQGTHEELMTSQGRYYRLAQKTFE